MSFKIFSCITIVFVLTYFVHRAVALGDLNENYPPLEDDKIFLDINLDLHLDIVKNIFWRHCLWKLPVLFVNELRQNSEYTVPLLFNASMEHCVGSALPLASIDLWIHHSDVIIRTDTKHDQIEENLSRACNSPHSDHACVVFVQTEAIWTDEIGAALLVRTIHQPFVLITASNSDICVPYPYYPFTNLHPAVEYLLRSPLLIRWYTKNPCVFAGHVGGKLTPLPLGPKFQFTTTDLQDFDKEPVKLAIARAGGHDPRALFLGAAKARRVCAGMWVPNTDRPHYLPYTRLRRRVAETVEALKAEAAAAPAADGDGYVVDSELREHGAYLGLLAGSLASFLGLAAPAPGEKFSGFQKVRRLSRRPPAAAPP